MNKSQKYAKERARENKGGKEKEMKQSVTNMNKSQKYAKERARENKGGKEKEMKQSVTD